MKVTLANLHEVSEQQVFDQVARHLLTQMAKSEKRLSEGLTNCVYRSPGGLMCAAGCLIADSEYDSVFDNHMMEESNSWETLVNYNLVPNHHVEFITSLQIIHDVYMPYDWKRELVDLANYHNLNADVIKEFDQ